MPINQDYDYALDGQGFMLARDPQGGRAWRRTGIPDTPGRGRTEEQAAYGNVDDTLDHPEVWDDWTGGFGQAYRRPELPNAIHWSGNFDMRFPRQAIHCQVPQTLAPARYASTHFNADWFLDVPLPGVNNPPPGAGAVLVLGRNYVVSYTPTQYQNTAGSAFDRLYEATAGPVGFSYGHRPATFGSFTYIPNLDGSSFLQRSHSGTDYTLGPDQTARWFSTAAGRLWFSFGRYRVRSIPIGADPLVTGNYAATLELGNGHMQTQDAMPIENQLYLSFPDGAWQGNLSGTFNNVMNDIGFPVHTENGTNLTVHNGGLVYAAGPHIWWYKPSTYISELREIGPTALMSNRSGIQGRITCVESYGKWLYAGLFTGSSSWFLAGRDASPPFPYVWYPLHNFNGTICKVQRIHVDGITSTSGGVAIPARIWCCTASTGGPAGLAGTTPIFYWPIPAGDDNPIADGSFSPNYLGSATAYLGAADWGAPATPKVWRSVEVWSDNLASNSRYLQIGYTLDGTPASTQMPGQAPFAFASVNVSPRSIAYSDPTSTNPPNLGFAGEPVLQSFSASANQTPIYRGFIVRGTMRPRSVDTITAHTRIAPRMRDRRNRVMRPAAMQIQQLRSFAEGSNHHRLKDLAGATSWVAVLPPIEEEEYYQEGSDEPEMVATVRMAVLTFSGSPTWY